jgi:hypothetical protein
MIDRCGWSGQNTGVMKSQTAEFKRSTRGIFPLANLLLT